jgi:hypothetical protein
MFQFCPRGNVIRILLEDALKARGVRLGIDFLARDNLSWPRLDLTLPVECADPRKRGDVDQ